MALGDVTYDDANYTGETGDSKLSLQYYRNKAREFQVILNNVDTAALAAENLIASDVDDELTSDLLSYLDQYESRKTLFKVTAEAINAAAATINAVGGRFPELSIPGTLGLAPIILPVAGIAAIATAATLIAWGVSWLNGLNQRLATAQAAGLITDPDKRDAFVVNTETIRTAAAAANGSTMSQIANVVKWGAFAFLGFIAWQAYETHSNRRR